MAGNPYDTSSYLRPYSASPERAGSSLAQHYRQALVQPVGMPAPGKGSAAGQAIGAAAEGNPSAGSIPTFANEPGPKIPRLPKPGVYPYGAGTNLPGALNGPTSLTGKYFPGLTGTQQSFYQSREGMGYAFDHVVAQMAKPGTFAHEWLMSNKSQILSDFVNASTADPNLQLTDYLQQQAPKLAEKYTGLRGWERGEGAASFGPGRQVYR